MKSPQYGHIDYIYARLLEDMVSVDVPRRLLTTIFKYLRDYIFFELLEGNTVSLKGIGKIRLHKKRLYPGTVPAGRFPNNNNPSHQYYVKFIASPNLRLRLREAKGTNSAAELRTLQKKQEFISERWASREKHMATKGGYQLRRLEKIKEDYRRKRKRIKDLRKDLGLDD